MTDIFHIDGGIRDSYINGIGGRRTLSPRKWSFRVRSNDRGTFYPFPSTFTDFVENDEGLAFNSNNDRKSFLESIPCVKVRAYVPTTITNEVFNLLGDAWDAGKTAFNKVQEADSLSKAAGIIGGSIADNWNSAKQFLTNFGDYVGNLNNMETLVNDLLAGIGPDDLDSGGTSLKDTLILKLPYVLYYALLSTKTNNMYEFPAYITEGFMDTDGTYGWNDSNDFGAEDMMGGRGLRGFFGWALNNFYHGINTNYMPMFNPRKGRSDKLGCKISFALFNDTCDRAINNYCFVHALMLNNMWLQYGFIQAPGSLYDVEIVGGNRFFMCSGKFDLKYLGTLRTAPSKFKSAISDVKDSMIPDAYLLTLSFDSLLPSNFNTYMLARLAMGSSNWVASNPGQKSESLLPALTKNIANNLDKASEKPEDSNGQS